jgi:HAD superfamily hydrolase (TIGR01509 family)
MMRAEPEAHLSAVLFDMDGLLVDTEPLWFLAEQRVVNELGGLWSKPDQEHLLGSNLDFAAAYMVDLTDSKLPVDQVARMLQQAMTDELRAGHVTFQPGALELVEQLRGSEVATALVTSSVREHVELVLATWSGQRFEVVVTGDDVTHKKPHPAPYQRALRQLGASAAHCVVLEDSPAGVASAEAAGCVVVAVPGVVEIATAPRRHVVSSLADVDLDLLRRAVTQ